MGLGEALRFRLVFVDGSAKKGGSDGGGTLASCRRSFEGRKGWGRFSSQEGRLNADRCGATSDPSSFVTTDAQ